VSEGLSSFLKMFGVDMPAREGKQWTDEDVETDFQKALKPEFRGKIQLGGNAEETLSTTQDVEAYLVSLNMTEQ
jgi:hypothetical protein